MSPTADALAATLTLGLPVFPCRASKKPAGPHGFRDAVIDADEIERLWDRHPGPLIGVPTWAATGFDVIDVDPPRGEQWLDENRHRLPMTRTHRTRSGGWHILFACRPGSVTLLARSRRESMFAQRVAMSCGGPRVHCRSLPKICSPRGRDGFSTGSSPHRPAARLKIQPQFIPHLDMWTLRSPEASKQYGAQPSGPATRP